MHFITINYSGVSDFLCYVPLTPKSDQHLFPPNNITPESNITVMRIKEMITNLKKLLLIIT